MEEVGIPDNSDSPSQASFLHAPISPVDMRYFSNVNFIHLFRLCQVELLMLKAAIFVYDFSEINLLFSSSAARGVLDARADLSAWGSSRETRYGG